MFELQVCGALMRSGLAACSAVGQLSRLPRRRRGDKQEMGLSVVPSLRGELESRGRGEILVTRLCSASWCG